MSDMERVKVRTVTATTHSWDCPQCNYPNKAVPLGSRDIPEKVKCAACEKEYLNTEKKGE